MSDKKVDMVFVMLTDILNESTELLCCGKDAVELATSAYHLSADDYSLMLPGVVSKKETVDPKSDYGNAAGRSVSGMIYESI